MTKAPRVAIYARFSTDKQRDASIQDQVDSCRDYALRQGWQITGTYDDRATSGASMFRPGIERLQRDAKAGQFDIVLAEAMDRLSRNLADIAKFHERMEHAGIKIWTLTEAEVNAMMIGMKGTMNAILLRDIGLKTLRVQRGRVREGKIAGGNAYGYDVLPGTMVNGKEEFGNRAINPTEAEVVRRIFADYASGLSPLKIAEQLNIERVPGPRGGAWGSSTIHGNRDRGTGILNNELYIGRMVWNRLHYSKDPDTKKRGSKMNPKDIVMTVDVPELRIIDDELWQAVRARQGALISKATTIPVWDRRRPKFLFSGLMTCGCCGSGYSKVSKDSFGCSAARKKGRAVCANRRIIKQTDLEARVLHALEHHLMDEEAVRIFCEEYTAERNRLQAQAMTGRAQLERDLRAARNDHRKLVDAILAGVPAEQVKDRMIALDVRRQELERQLDASPAPDPLRFHPSLAGAYRARIGQLIGALSEPDRVGEAKEALRGLIDRIELQPDPAGDGVLIGLQGALAGLLRLATGTSRRSANSVESAEADFQDTDIVEELVLVAGVGFEPTTFRL